MKKNDNSFFMDDEKIKKLRKNEEKKREKLRELNSIDEYNDRTKGSKILMYFLLAITFVSVVCYFAVTLIYSKNVVEQLTTIVSCSLLTLFACFFLAQSLFLDHKKGRFIVCLSCICLTCFSVFNILVETDKIALQKQETVPDFVSKNLTEVVKWANKNEITLNQIYETSDITEEYGIISQDVMAGTLLKNIEELTVVVSEGPNLDKEVIVPNFIGKNVDDVIKFVEENYLSNVSIDFEFSDIERDQIMSQDKSGQMKRNDQINFVASLGSEDDLSSIDMKDLVGSDLFHATTWVKRFGFKYVLEYEYSDTVQKGYVLKQSTEKGIKIDPKTTEITLTISKGPKIKVPDLTKYSVEELTNWIVENNLKVEFSESYDESIKVGEIISVSVNEGDTIEQGTLVSVVVSKGELRYEKFTTAAEFRAWAEEYKISYKEEYEFNDNVSSGSIIKSSHNEGDIIKNNDTVIIYVSQGKSVKIPNFVGKSKSDISKECSKLGLKCSFKYGGYNSSIQKDVATNQSKKANSTVASGTSVVITLSSGKATSYSVTIQPEWLAAGSPDNTISKLKSELQKACPGVTFVFKKKAVNTGVGLVVSVSPSKAGSGGHYKFTQGETYTFYIGSAS